MLDVKKDEKDRKKIFARKFQLQDKLSRHFKTDKVDVVILNTKEYVRY